MLSYNYASPGPRGLRPLEGPCSFVQRGLFSFVQKMFNHPVNPARGRNFQWQLLFLIVGTRHRRDSKRQPDDTHDDRSTFEQLPNASQGSSNETSLRQRQLSRTGMSELHHKDDPKHEGGLSFSPKHTPVYVPTALSRIHHGMVI